MEKLFVPKNLEVIRSPRELVDCLLANKSGSFSLDGVVKTEANRLLARLSGNPDVLLYDEDFPNNQQLLALSDKSQFVETLTACRARVFEVLSHEIPTMMLKQTGFDKEVSRADVKSRGLPRWQALAGLSPEIAQDCSTQDLVSLRAKKSVWTGAAPFVLHTGSSGVVSPFLAEEHVFCGKDPKDGSCSMVTLAPERSPSPTLENYVQRLPQEVSSLLLWHAMQGCEALHRSGFVHGDVKPENIFVTRGGQLFDFDFAVPIQSVRGASGGTPPYLDESHDACDLDYHHFSKHNGMDIQANLPARDVFAFGVTLGSVLSRNKNWPEKISYQRSLKDMVGTTLPPGPYRDLLADMTKLGRVDRPSLPEVINRLGSLLGQPEVKF